MILQVTKRCDFDCSFCSETLQMKDPSLDQLHTMAMNLSGVSRVFLSGGEPLMRRDLVEVVDIFDQYIVGLPTNATRGMSQAPALAGRSSSRILVSTDPARPFAAFEATMRKF